MEQRSRVFRAGAAWTGRRLIERARLVERAGRIVSLGNERDAAAPSGAEVIDFGGAIILPGFINAHCHLECSCLKGRLRPGTEFSAWLAELAGCRFAMGEDVFAREAVTGLAEAVEAGTTAMLDIFTRGEAERPLRASGLRAWAFLEAIRLDPSQAEAAYADLFNRLTRLAQGERFRAGLSPHAPYTVSIPLARKIGRLAEARRLPLAIHLAETEDERQMLATGGGPLADLFRSTGFLPNGWEAPGLSPVSWAERAGLLGPRTLVIHGNYIDDDEIGLLSKRGVSLAFCPRSHAFFGRGPHPLPKLLAAGVNVCIGTDSLASNDRLDLLAELTSAKGMFPQIPAQRLFEMIGANVARFLGLGRLLGALAEGFECDLTVVRPAPPLGRGAESALGALLEEGAARVKATVVGGDVLWREDE